ncbi:MAG: hypothetical protein ABSH16_06825 [Sedimentisphaerales bacterium]
MSENQFLTPGRIAAILNCPLHQVLYLLRARCITPIGRAGHLRVFDEKTVDVIRSELATNKQQHSFNNQPESSRVATGTQKRDF